MGMDPQAEIFYGYEIPIEAYSEETEEIDDNPKLVDGVTPVWNNQYEQYYLAIKASKGYYDWDYNPKRLQSVMYAPEQIEAWNQTLMAACTQAGLFYNPECVGWWVVCDYR